MTKRVSIRHKRKEAPEWIFPWRPRGESYLHRVIALIFVTVLFAIFVTSVKIRVTMPTPWAAKKAAVILAPDDAGGLALTLQAREGGPFPSRFEPSEWQAFKDLEQSAFAAARWTQPAYQPALRPLKEMARALPVIVDPGEPVLPSRRVMSTALSADQDLRLTPVLEPLSGINHASLPKSLPTFDAVVDGVLASETWRFLIRLGPSGEVLDAVSLSGGDEKRQALLTSWLRRAVFSEDARVTRWISVAVDFVNQSRKSSPAPTPDGTLDR